MALIEKDTRCVFPVREAHYERRCWSTEEDLSEPFTYDTGRNVSRDVLVGQLCMPNCKPPSHFSNLLFLSIN
jgi:hypothetical protein